MNKKIIILAGVIAAVLILIFCCGSSTYDFYGIKAENGENTDVTIHMKIKNTHKIFKRHISGNIIIYTDKDEKFIEYIIGNNVYWCGAVDENGNEADENGYHFAGVSGYDKTVNRYEAGYLSFDDEFRNIVITTTSDRVIYSADEEFRGKIDRLAETY